MPAPAIALLPYKRRPGLFPGRIPLDGLLWPLGQPAALRGKTVADLGENDHLISHALTSLHYNPLFGLRAKLSMMVVEPKCIHDKHLRRLYRSHKRFFRVLSYDDALLAAIPNGVFFPLGTTWVPDWRDLTIEKTRLCSLIASNKRALEGHLLRHEIVDWLGGQDLDVDILGRGYRPFAQKSEGLAPYRFSVIIENIRERNYFSEKLLDAVLCETVPIYWGCPNIADFMDVSGMMICNTAAEVKAAIERCSEAEYAARLPALRAIKPVADSYGDLDKRAAQAVLDSL